ncbi:hypothetical protein K435DRAFT_876965 [Dendrothele bispora CBS 962.96]|uniref:Uncharacterized protein n=1 Tax=Dendrothele bispora (strain CBS 962.96) TaxID=1314807 RepID=A0A4S8KRA6_DENBC|nr:hypothetical protein K435DRAFT_876965 [Dendrothele bispora CBS 962.96]
MNAQDDYPTGQYLMQNPPRIIRGLPAYLDTAINDDDRRMIFFIISHTPRYRLLHLCPGYRQSDKPYHRLTMPLPMMEFDVEFYCDHCERPPYLQEDEKRHLCRLSEEYRARVEYRYEMTADGFFYLPAAGPLTPSPPASPGPEALPPPPPLPALQPQVLPGPTTQQVHPQGPPPPYTPPVLSTAGYTGVGTRDHPFNLDSVQGTGTSTDPIDLCEDDEN